MMNLKKYILIFIIGICILFIESTSLEGYGEIITTTPKERTGTLEQGNKTKSTRIPGRISKQKCKEYEDNLFTEQIIIGGTQAKYLEFPHMVLLGYQSEASEDIQWSCGGSLISKNFVLTAAHCVKGRTKPPKYARLGITDQSDHSTLQERNVSETIPHPDYRSRSKYHDIALIRLDENVHFDRAIYPACLYREKDNPEGKAVATGWGYTEFLGPGSNHLLKVTLDFFSNENCTKKYKSQITNPRGYLKGGIIDDLMICAGSSEEIKSTCQGDSGGPLQVYHTEKIVKEEWDEMENYTLPECEEGNDFCEYARNRMMDDDFVPLPSMIPDYNYTETGNGIPYLYDIVGVTSFGRACSLHKGVPGIYTRVSNYIDWIENIVWPENI